MPYSLNGRLALVTGAAGGIGAAIARTLAELGARVALAHFDTAGGAMDIAQEIADAGGTAEVFDADLRSPTAPAELHAHVQDRMGPPDILVTAAGDYPRTPHGDLSRERWDGCLALNLTAHHLLAQAAAPAMIDQRHGRIITIGSVLASTGRHDLADYIAAKAGLEGLTRALARELGEHGITVNCVAPGSIHVPAEERVVLDSEAMEKRQLVRQCVQRRGRPEDVASAVAYLAGDEAGFITGQTLRVDGGWVLA
ncbi:SDR family NAD(P)-dependent oxidoreductase [Nocardiopsis kunsanensis]|uniref:SDR family NAD(P)-dependent oxidoreductase n=1 Tax=Nocardiopsis kunsanensis TaxID=141693 RepID=UPI0003471EAB|nr:SDR family oxidoreductase [Nocardiopsis kunsanensis]